MKTRASALFDDWSWWFGYPLGAVVVGGFLGWVAGNHPRDPDSLALLLDPGESPLADAFWIGLVVVAGVALLGFLISFGSSDSSGAFRRLADGCGCAIFVLIGLGTLVAACLGLAVLSWWAGLGAGSELGALLGATSVVGAIGLGTISLPLLGRLLGRYMVNKQREVVRGSEEEVDRH